MTTPLPQGLIRVVSATQTEEPSDPADVIYERKQALYNFWKGKSVRRSRLRHDRLTKHSSRCAKSDDARCLEHQMPPIVLEGMERQAALPLTEPEYNDAIMVAMSARF